MPFMTEYCSNSSNLLYEFLTLGRRADKETFPLCKAAEACFAEFNSNHWDSSGICFSEKMLPDLFLFSSLKYKPARR